jgi:hypothetical protein
MSERYEPRKRIVLTYTVRNFRSGQSVTVNIYDINGTSVFSSAMTEIGSTGIYQAGWTPTSNGTFFAVADCSAFPAKDMKELIIGGKPGDFPYSSGIIPKGFKITWTEDEKKDLISSIRQILKNIPELKANLNIIDRNVLNSSKARMELDSRLENTFKRFLENSDLGKGVENFFDKKKFTENFYSSLSELKKEVFEDLKNTQINSLSEMRSELMGMFQNLEKIKNSAVMDIEQINRSFKSLKENEILKKIERFSILADELNSNLNLFNLNPKQSELLKKVDVMLPLLDELKIDLQNGKSGFRSS